MAQSKIKSNIEGEWINVPAQPSPTVNSLKYMVRNGIVYLNVYDNGQCSFTARTWVKMGTLPEGARPSTSIYSSWNNRNGQGGEIVIEADGDVMMNSNYTGNIFISTQVIAPIN